ncbi:MAG: DUF2892 domain-containing protein [Candidatus Moranbacteria bacterium]|jgi:hypothetical protein|nr:DUF2892 domain-containing protein [Candidatus Moranbacteria bacterium]
MKKNYKQNTDSWYLERAAFLVAGILIFVSALLVLAGFSRWIYFLLFVGVMLINFAFSGYCPMAILLSKLGVKEK